MSVSEYVRKLFSQARKDASDITGTKFKAFFFASIALPIGIYVYLYFTNPEKAKDKAIWFLCTWLGIALVYMFTYLFMVVFVSPYKLLRNADLRYENDFGGLKKKYEEVTAQPNIQPGDRMRFDKLHQFIVELEAIKGNIENREPRSIPQFNKVNDACADFIATAFPEFHDFPTKSRPQDVQRMRHNQEDFITYESKCENAVNALYKLKQYYT